MLYLIATPIGNLEDITLRALNCLGSVDYILCEDTRHSKIFLNFHGIHCCLKSYHKFNEKKEQDPIVHDLKEGKEIALISDAGSPGIADPGALLVRRCQEEGLSYTFLPGPSSLTSAIAMGGFSSDRYQYIGFLPKKASERKELLMDAFYYPGVTVCFESPARIHKTLQEIDLLSPDQQLAIAREMTKIYEECRRGTACELLEINPRGEFVLLIKGDKPVDWTLSPQEHVAHLQEVFSLSKPEAIKLAASLRGVPKKEIYF